jgi:hypothetical protein
VKALCVLGNVNQKNLPTQWHLIKIRFNRFKIDVFVLVPHSLPKIPTFNKIVKNVLLLVSWNKHNKSKYQRHDLLVVQSVKLLTKYVVCFHIPEWDIYKENGTFNKRKYFNILDRGNVLLLFTLSHCSYIHVSELIQLSSFHSLNRIQEIGDYLLYYTLPGTAIYFTIHYFQENNERIIKPLIRPADLSIESKPGVIYQMNDVLSFNYGQVPWYNNAILIRLRVYFKVYDVPLKIKPLSSYDREEMSKYLVSINDDPCARKKSNHVILFWITLHFF